MFCFVNLYSFRFKKTNWNIQHWHFNITFDRITFHFEKPDAQFSFLFYKQTASIKKKNSVFSFKMVIFWSYIFFQHCTCTFDFTCSVQLIEFLLLKLFCSMQIWWCNTQWMMGFPSYMHQYHKCTCSNAYSLIIDENGA